MFRSPARLTAFVRGRRSLGSALQATLVPATPGWETCGLTAPLPMANRRSVRFDLQSPPYWLGLLHAHRGL